MINEFDESYGNRPGHLTVESLRSILKNFKEGDTKATSRSLKGMNPSRSSDDDIRDHINNVDSNAVGNMDAYRLDMIASANEIIDKVTAILNDGYIDSRKESYAIQLLMDGVEMMNNLETLGFTDLAVIGEMENVLFSLSEIGIHIKEMKSYHDTKSHHLYDGGIPTRSLHPMTETAKGRVKRHSFNYNNKKKGQEQVSKHLKRDALSVGRFAYRFCHRLDFMKSTARANVVAFHTNDSKNALTKAIKEKEEELSILYRQMKTLEMQEYENYDSTTKAIVFISAPPEVTCTRGYYMGINTQMDDSFKQLLHAKYGYEVDGNANNRKYHSWTDVDFTRGNSNTNYDRSSGNQIKQIDSDDSDEN